MEKWLVVFERRSVPQLRIPIRLRQRLKPHRDSGLATAIRMPVDDVKPAKQMTPFLRARKIQADAAMRPRIAVAAREQIKRRPAGRLSNALRR
jgi:hypothetical protein